MDIDQIDELNAVAAEMDAVASLLGSASESRYGFGDAARGLHVLIHRWTDTIERATAGATETGTAEPTDPRDTFTVALLPHEADALRARAAAHGVSAECELLALVDAAIQRHRAAEGGR